MCQYFITKKKQYCKLPEKPYCHLHKKYNINSYLASTYEEKLLKCCNCEDILSWTEYIKCGHALCLKCKSKQLCCLLCKF